jgi:UDP-N-acetylglucosamine--N-acetylmuramyl-(pentapeptide) pyrophosphoryl-undecaprenol N-acetylglucosamine transferase
MRVSMIDRAAGDERSGQTFIFAGGGSGGHLSPGLAVAERLGELDPSARAYFVCSRRDVDRTMLAQARVTFEQIPGSPFSLRPGALVRFAADFVRSRRAARAIIHRLAAQRVVALGGFVAAPVVSAAIGERLPVTLVNLDAPPGRANRLIARHCQQVLTAVPVPEMPHFAQQVVGMPVRRGALAPGPPDACRTELGLDPSAPTLLVTGASQGARSINALLAALVESDAAALNGWQVLHLSGPGDEQRLSRAYTAAGVEALVRPFLHEMGLAWGAADLAVSRAGASSVAEAWANAVPTIFLPYPHHRDRHQERNARPMAEAGGAVLEVDRVDCGENLRGAGAAIRRLLADDARRGAMRSSLCERRTPDAAATIARLLLGQSGGDGQDG